MHVCLFVFQKMHLFCFTTYIYVSILNQNILLTDTWPPWDLSRFHHTHSLSMGCSANFIPDLPTIHKLFLFLKCLHLCLTHSGVHTETLVLCVHTPLKEIRLDTQVWMTLWPSTSIRAPSLTIHKHHSSACCLMWKLHALFLSTWEIFWGVLIQHGWGETLWLCPLL